MSYDLTKLIRVSGLQQLAQRIKDLYYDKTQINEIIEQNVPTTENLQGIVPIEKGGTGNDSGYIKTGAIIPSDVEDCATAEGGSTESPLEWLNNNATLIENLRGPISITREYSFYSDQHHNLDINNGYYIFNPVDLKCSKILTCEYDEINDKWIVSLQNNIGTVNDVNGYICYNSWPYVKATGTGSHAEGYGTSATAPYSHTEGLETYSYAEGSHAEGNRTIAGNDYAHSEGSYTKAWGFQSHAEGTLTRASGSSSHAEGIQTIATGGASHAEGNYTQAVDLGNHTEGFLTKTCGKYSHAEGGCNQINLDNWEYTITLISGNDFTKIYNYSNDGNYGNQLVKYAQILKYLQEDLSEPNKKIISAYIVAIDEDNHSITLSSSIGLNSIDLPAVFYISKQDLLGPEACNDFAHAEGNNTLAKGKESHAEGKLTVALGEHSHAEGLKSVASGEYSHAEGYDTQSTWEGSHAEGISTKATGLAAHAEGYSTLANGHESHAEGDRSKALGSMSHAEGNYTIASGIYTHSEGQFTIATGLGSHAEGKYIQTSTTASGDKDAVTYTISSQNELEVGQYITFGIAPNDSIAQILSINSMSKSNIMTVSETLNPYSDVTNYYLYICTSAQGESSHAEGIGTSTIGTGSHAEGCITTAFGNNSHTEGIGTVAKFRSQHVFGEYNIIDNDDIGTEGIDRGKYVEIVGGGTNKHSRYNLRTLDWEGNEILSGNLIVEGNITGNLFFDVPFTGSTANNDADCLVSINNIVEAYSNHKILNGLYELPDGATCCLTLNKVKLNNGRFFTFTWTDGVTNIECTINDSQTVILIS